MIGTISCGCARYLATVVSHLVAKIVDHVKNSTEFTKEVRKIKLDLEEELRLYVVSALFTIMPVDKALEVIREKLHVKKDDTLKDRPYSGHCHAPWPGHEVY